MLISFVVVMALFAMMFKWLPDVSVGWRDVWLGAFLTALFFEIGKAAIGFYIGPLCQASGPRSGLSSASRSPSGSRSDSVLA
jgi:uncharacterized BrkB/YihY/UPF0761 family membrane protein